MTVELVDYMGSDASIVNAARVSFHKRASHPLSEADEGLIRFLMRNRHATPFEMVQFQFRVRCPIGVAREWRTHRIGSFNEESTRYVEMRKEFYVPELINVRAQVGKPGAYTFEMLDEEVALDVCGVFDEAYDHAYTYYKDLLRMGVAKELARNVLPLGLLTEFIWSVNLRSLFNFLSLRTASNALLELRLEADQVLELIQPLIPVTIAAWIECGRQAI